MVLAHLALTSRYVHWFALVFSFQTQNYVSRRLKIEKLQASLHLVIIEALLGSRSLENFKATTYCNQSVGSAVLFHSFQCPHQTACLCCPRNDFYAWHCLTLLDNLTTSSSLAPQDSLPMLNTGVISCLRTGFLLWSAEACSSDVTVEKGWETAQDVAGQSSPQWAFQRIAGPCATPCRPNPLQLL